MTPPPLRSNLDAIGAGSLARGAGPTKLDHFAPWQPGAPLGQHLRIERLARLVEGRHLYLANNSNPLWNLRMCWSCGNRYSPNAAQACTICGTPLAEKRFLATVRYGDGPWTRWETFMRRRLHHLSIVAPVAAFYRGGLPVTVYPYNGARLLQDQPAPLAGSLLTVMAHRLAAALQYLHANGVHLAPFTSSNILVMPDGTAKWSDLDIVDLVTASKLARHVDRPILNDVRRLCEIMLRCSDPDDPDVYGFFEAGAKGRYGSPKRFAAALEQFTDVLSDEPSSSVHAAFTDVGLVRSMNEDTWGWRRIDKDFIVYVVADGMGGHSAGEVASALARDSVLDFIQEGVKTGRSTSDALKRVLVEAVKHANRTVVAASSDKSAGMGTTIAILLIVKGQIGYVAHVGDARIYLLRKQALKQVTSDHSLVQMLVDRGKITPAEARVHPKANVILSFVGQDADDIDIDVDQVRLLPGDRWLLCSDGLWGEVTDEHLQYHLTNWREPRRCVQRMVRQAYNCGGKDNITAIVVDVVR